MTYFFIPPPMGTVWTIIIGIHICSLLFLGAYLRRLLSYARKYRMPESKYTLLFGWVNLNHIVVVYVIAAVLFVALSLTFLFLF